MRTFIEMLAADGGRLIVEAASIVGVRTPPGKTKTDQGTADKPVTLILRNADPVQVMCIEPTMIFGRIIAAHFKAEDVKARMGDDASPIAVEWLDHADLEDADG